jgi:hypothetical protein
LARFPANARNRVALVSAERRRAPRLPVSPSQKAQDPHRRGEDDQPLSQAIDCILAFLTGTPPGDHLGLALAELAGTIVIAFLVAITLFKRQTAR